MSVSVSFHRLIRSSWIAGGTFVALAFSVCAPMVNAQGYAQGVSSSVIQEPIQQASQTEAANNSGPVQTLSVNSAQPIWNDQISVSADFSEGWREGETEVYVLRGDCLLQQGEIAVKCEQMVMWREHRQTSAGIPQTGAVERLAVYLEKNVRYTRDGRDMTDTEMFVRLTTTQPTRMKFKHRLPETTGQESPLFQHAVKFLNQPELPPGVEPTQYVVPEDIANPSQLELVQFQPADSSLRRLRIFRRSSQPFNATSRRSDDTIPPEQITTINGGIQVLIDGVSLPDSTFEVGTIDLSADRVVIWTEANGSEEFRQEMLQSRDSQMQLYLEGNIIIRQGNRKIEASRAFYDARSQRALIIDAELRAYVPQLRSDIRVRADRIRQLSPDHLHAQNAWTSTSQYGKPGYRIQSTDVYLENRPTQSWLGPQPLTIDPETGQPVRPESLWMTSINNTFILEDFPLLYTPIVSGPAENPNLPIRNLNISQNRIFGLQAEVTWDLEQIFGMQLPDTIDWVLRTDYYTERGPRLGTDFEYKGWGLMGPNPTSRGDATVDLMYDDDRDNLGRDRRTVPLEENTRGMALWEHQERLPYDLLLRTELGYVSDRNYLEQYYESDFDRIKDIETLAYLQQNLDNWSWSLLARPELNDFEASTEWLPKADLYALSEPLFNSLLTYSSHSSVGYGMIEPGDPSPFPADDIWNPLPYLAPVEGMVAMTRQQVDAPFTLGPINFVPFVMGEAAYWDEDLTGSSLDRLVGQAGARAHMMMWKMYPYVQSEIFNLRGLMHKIDFNAEYTYTDSSTNYAGIPQYNEFDENAQERFRRRLLTNTFGGALPLEPGFATSPYDPRFYIIRSGAGSSVTSPYHELIEDQQALRFSVRQRLQTKKGPPERTRVEDWMIFEAGAAFFPDSQRDNFGEDFGLIYGDYEWRIGARNKVVANATLDTFGLGQQNWSVGLLSQRSLRGSAYLGYRQNSGGLLNSQTITASYSYVMSPKWISTFGTAYDIGERQNRGQSLTITRVGEYALMHVGGSYDASKDNLNFTISFEPKIGPFNSTSTQLSSLLSRRR